MPKIAVPNEFFCPISGEMLTTPVIASDKHTYERKAIEQILSDSNGQKVLSPLTKEPLTSELIPNEKLPSQIRQFLIDNSVCDFNFFLQTIKSGTVTDISKLVYLDIYLSKEDEEGNAALQHAASRGDISVIDFLIEEGAIISPSSKSGITPLHNALTHGHIGPAHKLLYKGDSPHLPNSAGLTLFQLLKKNSAEYNFIREYGFPKFLNAPREFYCPLTKMILLDPVKASDEVIYERTAILPHLEKMDSPVTHQKLANKELVAQPELKKTIDDYLRNNNIPTESEFFNLVIKGLYKEIIQKSIPRSFLNIARDGKELLHYVAENGHIELLSLFLEIYNNCSPLDANLKTPLHYAAANGHVDCVRLLLSHGALMTKDNAGNNPIADAAAGDKTPVVRILGSKFKNDIGKVNHFGHSPLHVAAVYGKFAAGEELVKLGCDPTAYNNDGLQPIHMAGLNGRLEFVLRFTTKYKISIFCPTLNSTPLLAFLTHSKDGAEYVLDFLVSKNLDTKILSDLLLTEYHEAFSSFCSNILIAMLNSLDTTQHEETLAALFNRLKPEMTISRLCQPVKQGARAGEFLLVHLVFCKFGMRYLKDIFSEKKSLSVNEKNDLIRCLTKSLQNTSSSLLMKIIELDPDGNLFDLIFFKHNLLRLNPNWLNNVYSTGLSLLSLLASNPVYRKFLIKLIKNNSAIKNSVSRGALYQQYLGEINCGTSSFFWLSTFDEGVSILNEIYTESPSLLDKIPTDLVLKEFSIKKDSITTNVFFNFSETQNGIHLLMRLFNANPALSAKVSPEILFALRSNSLGAGHSIFKNLMGSHKGLFFLHTLFEVRRDLLNLLTENFLTQVSDIYAKSVLVILATERNSGWRLLSLLFDKNPKLKEDLMRAYPITLKSYVSAVMKMKLVDNNFVKDGADNESSLRTEDQCLHEIKKASENDDLATAKMQLTRYLQLPKSNKLLLHYAARTNWANLIHPLLTLGLGVKELDLEGHTALTVAITAGHYDFVERLIMHKETTELLPSEMSSITVDFLKNNNLVIVNLLLKLNVKIWEKAFIDGKSLLFVTTEQGKLLLLKFLLDAGVNLDSADPDGNSPLQSAVTSGQDDVISCLLDRVSNFSHLNKANQNVFHTLALKGSEATASLLLKKAKLEDLQTKDTTHSLVPALLALKANNIPVNLLLRDKEAQFIEEAKSNLDTVKSSYAVISEKLPKIQIQHVDQVRNEEPAKPEERNEPLEDLDRKVQSTLAATLKAENNPKTVLDVLFLQMTMYVSDKIIKNISDPNYGNEQMLCLLRDILEGKENSDRLTKKYNGILYDENIDKLSHPIIAALNDVVKTQLLTEHTNEIYQSIRKTFIILPPQQDTVFYSKFRDAIHGWLKNKIEEIERISLQFKQSSLRSP